MAGTSGNQRADEHLAYASVSENMSGPTTPRTVPEIVRVEEGTVDRGIYQFAVLYNGIATPSPTTADWDPSWNGRLVYQFGGGCGVSYGREPRQAACYSRKRCARVTPSLPIRST